MIILGFIKGVTRSLDYGSHIFMAPQPCQQSLTGAEIVEGPVQMSKWRGVAWVVCEGVSVFTYLYVYIYINMYIDMYIYIDMQICIYILI